MNFYRILGLCLLGLLNGCPQTDGGISISDAWVRAGVPGQKVGAAYMTLQSAHDTTLIKTESTAAGSVEIHSMSMNDDVMKMRRQDSLTLTAGRPAKLEPGGFHLMLFDLKQPLKVGENVEFTLHFKDSAGKTSSMELSAPIKADNN